jgi:hypothetical protein
MQAGESLAYRGFARMITDRDKTGIHRGDAETRRDSKVGKSITTDEHGHH